MSTQNTWSIIGRIGKNAEIKTTNNGQLLVFSIAVDRSYYDKNANKKIDKTQWVDVLKNISQGQTDKHGQYLQKGCLVQVEGIPYPSAWVDKEGKAQAKQCISAKSIQSLTWPEKTLNANMQSPQEPNAKDDNLPF